MGNNGYLKFILTILVLAIAFFGYLLVTAVDRVRESNLRLLAKLDDLQGRISFTAPVADPEAVDLCREPFANAEFFDRSAQSGGRMILAMIADTANMNYLINNEAMAEEFWNLCNSSLAGVNFEKPDEYEPQMAESWSVSDDHKVYRIKLRKGIYWHDFRDPVTGKEHHDVEVTAEDFKFFVDVIRNPAVNCSALRVYYQDLDSVKVLSRYEFEVRWSREYYGSKASTLGLSPLPRHFYHAYDAPFDGRKFNEDHLRNRMIVGCGPYQFVKWEKDRRVVFRRNPRYFGIRYGAAPALDFLVYEIIKHPNTRFQSLLSGEIDQLALSPDQWIQRADEQPFRDGTLKRYHYLLPQYTYLGWNLRNPLFSDARVRRALTMLIDRERIRKDVYFGLAETVTGPFFPKSHYTDQGIKPWPHDPAEAKKLLAEAGWNDEDGDGILEKDGRKFTFTMLQIATSSIQQRMMPMIKEMLASAGIDMKIQNVEWSVCLQRLEEQNFDACCLGWQSPFDPDPYQVWHSSQADLRGSSNHVGFKHAEADRILEELRSTFDVEKRIALAHRFCRILHEEQPYTFLFAPYSLVALSSRYRNVRLFPVGIPNSILWVPGSEQKKVPGL